MTLLPRVRVLRVYRVGVCIVVGFGGFRNDQGEQLRVMASSPILRLADEKH